MSKPKNRKPETPEQQAARRERKRLWAVNNRKKNPEKAGKWERENRMKVREIKRRSAKKIREADPVAAKGKRRTRSREDRERYPDKLRAYARKWYAVNASRVRPGLSAHSQERRDRLADGYIAELLKMTASEIPQEIIEAKRNILKTKRILKQIKKQIDENTDE